jgi:hypothetical protein
VKSSALVKRIIFAAPMPLQESDFSAGSRKPNVAYLNLAESRHRFRIDSQYVPFDTHENPYVHQIVAFVKKTND